jgi:hypothetical protein
VQNPLAMKLLEGTFPPGSKVTVDWKDDAFVFEPTKDKPAPKKKEATPA